MNPVAIIPAKGNSQRFPRKNMALLDGNPLVVWVIEAAQESGIFDRVVVSTEDTEIMEVAADHGALALSRNVELSTPTATVADVCIDVLKRLWDFGRDCDSLAVLLPTSPLRTAADIRAAYSIFQQSTCDTVMSVVPCSHPPQRALSADGFIRPYFGREYMTQAQKLETLYRHDGAIIFTWAHHLLSTHDFYAGNVVPYFMPRERSVDIDSVEDLWWAEFLLNRQRLPS